MKIIYDKLFKKKKKPSRQVLEGGEEGIARTASF